MTTTHLKVARIGNSRGVRIPAATLLRFGIGDAVIMEERSDGILLRPLNSAQAKLSWDATADAMARASEDWDDWDALSGEGLRDVEWHDKRPARVAEAGASYEARPHPKVVPKRTASKGAPRTASKRGSGRSR